MSAIANPVLRLLRSEFSQEHTMPDRTAEAPSTDAPATDLQRWEALTQRDPQADGSFFYAVKTTGVYCRPSCASRPPNRQNVEFFSRWADAEQAGFRACKRCQPNAASPREQRAEAIIRACQLIEASEEPPALKDLAAAVGLSPFYFHRLFKTLVGVTPKQYASVQRQRRLQDGLQPGGSVTQAIYEAGFGSSSGVYAKTADLLGMTPAQYKTGAAGVEIRFAIAPCFLGWVLVAATEQGVCAIEFGETPEVLSERLHSRFVKAQLRSADPSFAEWVAQVTAFVAAPSRGLDLPLDIQGTAFQQRVWKALQAIPPGTTASYAAVAERIGRPTAARAVARACASNPLAVAIPCHRVVRSDGELSGYRWGIERKRALLEREAAERGIVASQFASTGDQ